MDASLRAFLSRAYAFKTIADYDLAGSVAPTEADAQSALEMAAQFIERFTEVIANPPPR